MGIVNIVTYILVTCDFGGRGEWGNRRNVRKFVYTRKFCGVNEWVDQKNGRYKR